jgi:hypothetical protein
MPQLHCCNALKAACCCATDSVSDWGLMVCLLGFWQAVCFNACLLSTFHPPYFCVNGFVNAKVPCALQNVLRCTKRYNQKGVTSATRSQHGWSCAKPLAATMH